MSVADGNMKKCNGIARRALRCRRDDTSLVVLKSPGKAFAVALALLVVAITTPFAHAESIVGKISSVNGAVHIVRDGKTLAATNGMAIRLHDKVVTGADGSVTIVTSDHSLLRVDQSGSLSIGKSTMPNGLTAPSRSDCSPTDGFSQRGCYQ
jgi:hypothetical protein